MRFKTDWVSLIVGSKFTAFALFYFVFEGNFPITSPRGAYIWRGLFSEFYGIINTADTKEARWTNLKKTATDYNCGF